MAKIIDGEEYGFFPVKNKFVDDGHLAIVGKSLPVYMCLKRHANARGECFPSFTLLEQETGQTRPTISKSIKHLISLGYITRILKGSNRTSSSVYQITALSNLTGKEIKPVTSKEIKPVKEINQLKNLTTTGKNSLPQLVKKFNSKKTNRTRLIEQDSLRKSESENFLPQVMPQPSINAPEKNHQPSLIEQKKSGVKRIGSAPSVSFTAKRKEPHQIVRELITELSGDRYEEFIKRSQGRLAASDYWKEQLAAGVRITEGTILQRYAKSLSFYATDSDEAIAQKIAPVSTAIQTDVEMYGLDLSTAPQQTYQQLENNFCEEAYQAWLNEPAIVDMDVQRFKAEFKVSLSNFLDYLEQKTGDLINA